MAVGKCSLEMYARLQSPDAIPSAVLHRMVRGVSFDGQRFPVVMIDGMEHVGETMVVAMGITDEGTKRILGLRQGVTENATVCMEFLEDLQQRGLDTAQPTLLVRDGSKALHVATWRLWG